MAQRYHRPLALARLILVYSVVGLMLAFARPAPVRAVAGAIVVILGEALRVWAAGHLVKNARLVTSGPYRYTRNPLYLGRLSIFAGLCIMARLPYGANWLILLVGLVVFFGYYLPRKERVEPARLQALHGEAFQRYFREVPALLPLREAWDRGAADAWSHRRALDNREHWMVVGLAVVVTFLLWRSYSD
jgi:protein-S-isoprenylcysteine O-methyltransferase Ste14